ncbi:peptide chain release factor 1, mitochondrial-like isoform X3 [Salvia splendens]|uniref:peptide chain release factor 1, mitochondrial-like isoform X3 n=1 Tax=Salvia splendens TaxID=180675 RepID=UPI001C2763A1|nr:peptide chain release factor 1, mitochondrial-like isoform X3 [Salvia splendens]
MFPSLWCYFNIKTQYSCIFLFLLKHHTRLLHILLARKTENLFKRITMSKRAAFCKSKLYEFHSHFFNRPIIVYRPPQHRRIHLLTAKTLFRRLYSARAALSQSQPQLSNDLINIMEQKLSAIENRHAQLEAILNQPDASPEEYSTANKELKKLRHTIDVVSELRKKQQEIGGIKSLIDEAEEDKDMREMAADELGQASQEEERLRYMLLKSLLPKDDVDERDCILEVRAGTGGEEASLFVMDIFKMYEKYSQNKGWRFEVLGVAESDVKGYKEASAAISGADVYGKLKFESGIHRVQRVPMTEKSGRVHTSAVSVVILPQADQVDVQIRNEDLKIDTYRSGGSGGQSVNTTDSAVRITHMPTGLVVAIQDERSQHQNKAKALKVLCAKLYELERTRLDANRSKLRTEQIGSGDRSERIRTYNFPQGRVTDHRVGITSHAIDDIMEGEDLDTFVDALILQQEMDAIASFTST